MKKINKLISILLSLTMLFATTSAVASATESLGVAVIYTNDVHCAIDDYPVLAAYRAELIAQGKEVIVVDAGDAIQGEVIGALTEGEAIVDIMNAVGYDYAVPGNHEFDYGMDVFLDLAQNKAQYEYISSNFYNLSSVSPIFAPYAIEDFGAYQVAFVGISTPETITKSTPEYFKDEGGNFIYGFPVFPGGMTNEDLYNNVQDSVDSAVSDGADIVIAVGHTGEVETSDGWKTSDIIANTSGIDYYIDAHSHETVEVEVYKNENNEDVYRTSTGFKFNNFGVLTISGSEADFELINPDSVEVETMSAQAQSAYDAAKEKVDGYNDEIAYLYDEIGTSEAKLTTFDDDQSWAVRKRETNTGDFVADAYRAVTGADVAIANGGGIRSEIEIGSVTRKMLMDVNAFNNDMCVLEVTGQQLVDVLEHGARECPEPSGGFFQVSGVTFEIHTYNESPVICDQLDNFISIDETMPRRVQKVCVGGVPVDLEKTYTLAGSAYVLTQGGDGLTMLEGATVVQQEGLPCDSEMLLKYFTEMLDGKISAAQYGHPGGDGRIKLVDTHTHMFDTDECVCGAKKADYSGYNEAYSRFQQTVSDNDLNDAAIEYLREKQQEIIDEHLGGSWLRNNYSEDEQYILDGLEEAFNEMCDELEAGIADGTYIKPDFTEIESKIELFEKTHTDEKYKDIITIIKAELESIKESDPDSAAEVADEIAALEEKMNGVDACEHMCHSDRWLIGIVWKLVRFIFRIFDVQQYCDCGVTHY
ncbi:MAG: bifunctional metallophosphatase/5'-nucleotidase [Clostridia bacterium]|nr:bifunctional metallophosphatase/5'-nucleotidase [Clostridia bacterium]